MRLRELSIPGAFEINPVIHDDNRGVFLEWFARDRFEEETGRRMPLAQANCSVSSRGVLRGLHFSNMPPGQAKYVSCPTGAVLDVVVDLRTGSPTFGRWESVRLDDVDRKAVYIADGLGHAFIALSDVATLVYLCSEQYNPAHERAVDPLDPEIGIDWPGPRPTLSPRDSAAPSMREAAAAGILPSYEQCVAHYERERRAVRAT